MWLTAQSLVALGIDRCVQRVRCCIGSNARHFGSRARKRRSAYKLALADPDTHPGTLKKLREAAAQPSHDLLRYIAEQKVHKAETTADRRNLWFTLQFKRYAPIFLGQMKPRMNFWTAALDESQLPLPSLPEVAIAGRSNCGKSTLVNYLCGRHSAKVKREPGSTQELVFWRIGRPAQLCLVDLPGYGFAVASEERRLQWTEFALWYLRSRRNLSRVLLLVDARQGLKPSDKEMIAYFERHNVNWQIIVTKCDCVKAKSLARRLTILDEEVSSYIKMVGSPIPISALKRMGMEKLRDVLDELKVQKDIVKDGIRQRVYDLLEQKRIKRAERSRLRREKRQEKREQEKAEEQRAKHMETLGLHLQDEETPDQVKRESETPSLHELLSDTKQAEVVMGSHTTTAVRPNDDSAQIASPPIVPEARYTLDDRDSERVDGFMRSLFPNLPQSPHAEVQSRGLTPNNPFTEDVLVDQSPQRASQTFFSDTSADFGSPFEVRSTDEDSESDSDSEEVALIKPSVLRFDPMLPYTAHVESTDTRFEGLGNLGPAKFPHEISANQQVSLRAGWARPPGNQDRIYDPEDFASPQDIASGIRRFSPPAPTLSSAGSLMSEARKRYEREWATELESIDGSRSRVADQESSKQVSKQASNVEGRRLKPLDKSAKLTERPAYITKGGKKILTTGRASWRVVGRPPARILKKKRVKDVDKQFNLSDRSGRKRNLGAGLTWAEAKQHWINWFRKNKGKNRNRVLQADSPKQEDVVAEFEHRRQFPVRRRMAGERFDAAQRPRLRTGPGGAAVADDDM